MSTYKPRTEAQKAARRLREGSTSKKITIRKRGYPPVDMSKHKTGDALIAHIKAFDEARNLRSGSRYIIGGQEVMI